MPQRDQEIILLRRQLEILMSERQTLLRVAGAAAALIASLDSRRLPVGAVESAFTKMFGECEIIGVSVPSGVSDMPMSFNEITLGL